MMIPEMKRKGYDSSYAATLVCFGGIVGPIDSALPILCALRSFNQNLRA